MTKKMRSFTVPSTGEVVTVPPVSVVSLAMQIKRERPEPKPPLITVNIAGHVTQERNGADPDYLRAYAIWESSLQFDTTQKALLKIARKQRLTPEQIAEVDELREDDPDIPKNNRLAWLLNIAIGYDSEIRLLMNFASKEADPSEDGVTANANGFHGEIQGKGHMEVTRTQERDNDSKPAL